jgi:hypothetical protein
MHHILDLINKENLMRKVLSSIPALGICAILFVFAGNASASVLAVNLDNTVGGALGNGPYTIGWSFALNSPVTVIGLGMFDDSQDGLADSYPIAIWDDTGDQLVSADVPSGTDAVLNGSFRMVSVAPVRLFPGPTYYIGALVVGSDDPLLFPEYASGLSIAPDITFDQARFVSGDSLTMPAGAAGTDPAYFGPNFEFQAPEPSPAILCSVLGLVICGLSRHRRPR